MAQKSLNWDELGIKSPAVCAFFCWQVLYQFSAWASSTLTGLGFTEDQRLGRRTWEKWWFPKSTSLDFTGDIEIPLMIKGLQELGWEKMVKDRVFFLFSSMKIHQIIEIHQLMNHQSF